MRRSHDPAPITFWHLGRYGVSILPEKEGADDKLGAQSLQMPQIAAASVTTPSLDAKERPQ